MSESYNNNVSGDSRYKSWVYDAEGNVILYSSEDKDKNDNKTYYGTEAYTYDEDGNQLTVDGKYYYGDGTPNSEYSWKYIYTETDIRQDGYLKNYYENGMLQQESSTENFSDGSWISNFTEYSSDGLIMSERYGIYSDNIYEVKYVYHDDEGVIVGTEDYTENYNNGSWKREVVALHYENGLLVSDDVEVCSSDSDLCSRFSNTYEYDDNGTLLRKLRDGIVVAQYNADGSYVTYDENGNVIGKYNADGSPKVGKRIYTVEEATAAVSGKGKNTFIIKYR